VLAINTLSKRSSMTGYRSGFVAGDPGLIADLKRLRPATGVTPQEFIQRASVAAWRDEVHVEQNRERYRRKRDLLLDVFARQRRSRRGERGDVLPLGACSHRANLVRMGARPPRPR
jgi:aspartate/methionine/tyrosine aminotransferase